MTNVPDGGIAAPGPEGREHCLPAPRQWRVIARSAARTRHLPARSTIRWRRMAPATMLADLAGIEPGAPIGAAAHRVVSAR
ncbi:hypothetical protein [Sphingomonas sp. 67-41]|uniref:hypothetical protein n=1 Tax=Sphingomonas sp. 67-41 TaxID=1895850 RepID=UPI00257A83A2|nr:hypothetical protein [Sphingomonas sp. 67-41]